MPSLPNPMSPALWLPWYEVMSSSRIFSLEALIVLPLIVKRDTRFTGTSGMSRLHFGNVFDV